MNNELEALKVNRQILKCSLTRQFTRSPSRSRKRLISLPPLEAAQNQYKKLKSKIVSCHKESPKEQGLICLTIREINGLCVNTCRYTKTKEDKKYFLNNKYFDSCFNAMNTRKFQLFNK